MKLTGFLLWVGMSALTTYVANVIFRFSIFKNDKIFKMKTADLKLIIVMALSEIVMISYVVLNNVLGIFGYFGIFVYPIEDAILSGLLVSAGADGLYQMYNTILNYQNLLKAKKDLINKAKNKMGDE